MSEKKVPMRMCCGCGEMKPKKELIRVVKTVDNQIKLDFTGRVNGRGAYLCPDKACFQKAKKLKRIERSFECSISNQIYEELEHELSDKIL